MCFIIDPSGIRLRRRTVVASAFYTPTFLQKNDKKISMLCLFISFRSFVNLTFIFLPTTTSVKESSYYYCPPKKRFVFFCNDPEIEVIKTCEKRCSVMLSTVSCVGKKRSNEEERKNSEIFHLAFRLV